MSEVDGRGPRVLGADEQLTTWLDEVARVTESAHIRRHRPPVGPLRAEDVRAVIAEATEGVLLVPSGTLPDPALRVPGDVEGPNKHTSGQSIGHKIAHALGWNHG